MKKKASLYLEVIISMSILTIIFIPLLNLLLTLLGKREYNNTFEYKVSSFSHINKIFTKGYNSIYLDDSQNSIKFFLEEFSNLNSENYPILLLEYEDKFIILTPLTEYSKCDSL